MNNLNIKLQDKELKGNYKRYSLATPGQRLLNVLAQRYFIILVRLLLLLLLLIMLLLVVILRMKEK